MCCRRPPPRRSLAPCLRHVSCTMDCMPRKKKCGGRKKRRKKKKTAKKKAKKKAQKHAAEAPNEAAAAPATTAKFNRKNNASDESKYSFFRGVSLGIYHSEATPAVAPAPAGVVPPRPPPPTLRRRQYLHTWKQRELSDALANTERELFQAGRAVELARRGQRRAEARLAEEQKVACVSLEALDLLEKCTRSHLRELVGIVEPSLSRAGPRDVPGGAARRPAHGALAAAARQANSAAAVQRHIEALEAEAAECARALRQAIAAQGRWRDRREGEAESLVRGMEQQRRDAQEARAALAAARRTAEEAAEHAENVAAAAAAEVARAREEARVASSTAERMAERIARQLEALACHHDSIRVAVKKKFGFVPLQVLRAIESGLPPSFFLPVDRIQPRNASGGAGGSVLCRIKCL